MSKLALFGAIALVPAMVGPLQAATGGTITLSLCNGGTISLPAGETPPPGTAGSPCCAKGCRSDSERKGRKAFDRKQ